MYVRNVYAQRTPVEWTVKWFQRTWNMTSLEIIPIVIIEAIKFQATFAATFSASFILPVPLHIVALLNIAIASSAMEPKEWGIWEGNEKFLLNYGFIMSRLVCQIETKDRESHLVHDALILPEAKFFAFTQCFLFHRSTRRIFQVHSLPCTVRGAKRTGWRQRECNFLLSKWINSFEIHLSSYSWALVVLFEKKNQRIESFFYMKFCVHGMACICKEKMWRQKANRLAKETNIRGKHFNITNS